jgi:hypothetical protein
MEKIFDMEKMVDEYSRNARMALTFVYPTEIRNVFEKAIDLQVEASKTFTQVATEQLTKLTPASK